MIWKKDIKRLRQAQHTDEGVIYTRVWAVPRETDLATLGLAAGSTLPAETGIDNAEIIEVKRNVAEDEPGRMTVTVQALLPTLWTGESWSNPVRELAQSRIMRKTADAVTLERRFEVDDSALSEGSGGWTATGLPAVGDAYPSGTWSITPKVAKIELDNKYTPAKTLVTVTYAGYQAWGDVTG